MTGHRAGHRHLLPPAADDPLVLPGAQQPADRVERAAGHLGDECSAEDVRPSGAAVDAAFGPPRRCLIATESATAPVRKRRVALVGGVLRVVAGILGARLRRRRESPFFDAATGEPIRVPEVVRLPH